MSCSVAAVRDLPDEVLPVTDEELVLFEAMNQKEKEAFVRQRFSRVQSGNGEGACDAERDAERKAKVGAHSRSSVMETGRILEGQLQSARTGDTNAGTKAAKFALEQVVERKGAGDDQWFGDQMLKVLSPLIQHTEGLDKPMNEDATHTAIAFRGVRQGDLLQGTAAWPLAQEVRAYGHRHQ